MRPPDEDAAFSHNVHYGRYVTRRLRRAQRASLAADVEAATLLVLQRGREWEDAKGPVQDARADRDAADDELDSVAQDARANLAGRSADAVKKAPYTLIFPDGIGYYTAAPIDEEKKRYDELQKRLTEHLPANDEVRKDAVPKIAAGLDAFDDAERALAASLTAESLASTRLDAAEEAFRRLMTKVYGLLVSELGKPAAEKFFPKPSGARRKKGGGSED
ncbi:hypothetical protein [Polyangium jinanense]|uniref:Uncharacterized protein n=1 Tax=Polyangium jinanense TaxID=2829994 RepID=A0A9X3X6P1_9BACT|nr:hypothetical protein [Polyangium jinanense]MDC3955849.1 hypothetical protein [Polyangium jinanense]MDC3983208.1 hypothetical protein [Polyangium jinanense]